MQLFKAAMSIIMSTQRRLPARNVFCLNPVSTDRNYCYLSLPCSQRGLNEHRATVGALAPPVDVIRFASLLAERTVAARDVCRLHCLLRR
jgi:hypothetical protein